jgi:hypothetical protein
MIALLVPSRQRPKELQRMIQSAYDTSNAKIQIFVAVAPEEFGSYQAVLNLPASDRVGVLMVSMPENLPTAHKWNKLAELAMGEPNQLFMLGADDMIFQTPLWDEALINHYNALDKKAHVYHFQDSRDENGAPHPIMTREYIERMGYFVPPIFMHWFIDSWTVGMAKMAGCFTHLKDYLLVHDKPSDKGQADETHSRIREWGWHDRDKYVDAKMKAHLFPAECMRLQEAVI